MSNPILRHTKRLTLPLLLAATMAACSDQTPAPAATGKAVQADVIAVQTQKVPRVYITSGVVTSDHRISVSSRISGYIHEIAVREGDRVHKGDVLFHIDPADARQALEQARADLADARTDLDRFRSLLASEAVSRQQFDKVKLRYQVAKSKVAQAENQMSYAIVRAPVDGLVGKACVAVVGAADLHSLPAAFHPQAEGFGPPGHPKSAPNFGGIRIVHAHGVVGGCAALA